MFLSLLTTTFLAGMAFAGGNEDNAPTSRAPVKRWAAVGSSACEVTNHVEIIGAKALHAKGIRGTGTKAIVIDSCVDSKHEDLAGKLSESSISGTMLSDKPDMSDMQRKHNRKHNEHGTHTTGILESIAPGAKIKFIANTLNPAIALEEAAKSEGDVVTLSYVLPKGQAIEEALEKIVNSGKVVFIALGNDYASNPTKARSYTEQIVALAANPRMKGMITPIVNIEYDNSGKERLNSASNRILGICPYTIGVAGTDILSAAPGNEQAVHSGTSMATPAGAAGYLLLKEAYPDLTPQEILALMRQTSRKISLNNSYVFSNEYGNGVLNLEKAWERGTITATNPIIVPNFTANSVQTNEDKLVNSVNMPVEISHNTLDDQFSLDKLKKMNQASAEISHNTLNDEFSLNKLKEMNQAVAGPLDNNQDDPFSLSKLQKANQTPAKASLTEVKKIAVDSHPTAAPVKTLTAKFTETVDNWIVQPVKSVFTSLKNTVTRFTSWLWN